MQRLHLMPLIHLCCLLLISHYAHSDTEAKPQDSDPISLTAITQSSSSSPDTSQNITKSHAIAIHGNPKYPANFERFEYTSAKAKKGGKIRLRGIYGTFDSLNPFIAKGNPADNVGLIYDTLTTQAMDEPFTEYGLVAHTIEYPEDRSWIIFHMRPEARFHDGKPITADDIVYSFNLLLEKGNPAYKFFYGDVDTAEALSTHKVKFSFKVSNNRELALLVGQLPIFPQHFWQDKEFDKSSLEFPLGSGPYRVHSVDAGRNITYARVEDYWGRDLSVNRGFYNFDRVSVDFYRDNNIAVEALKAGEYDYRWENSSKFWATAYDVPSINSGELVKLEIPHKANSGLQAFIFNIRKPIFQDIKLRKAIGYAFDFEWSNKMLFYNIYKRSYSYFTNSEFAATGLPGKEELALLEPFRNQLPESVFTEPYAAPQTDGSGHIRPNLRTAKKILDDAGYKVKKNQLYNSKGEAIRFEILLYSQGFKRIVNPFVKNLARLGIIVDVRLVDTSQLVNRRRSFEFDMLVHPYPQSESLGNEQRDFWSSEAADMEGSRNYIGIKNPVIDKLIDNVANVKDRESLVIAGRALDRVLLHNYYMIPNWYKPSSNVVYWNKFGIPDVHPIYDQQHRVGIFTWWYDPEKARNISIGLNTDKDNKKQQ